MKLTVVPHENLTNMFQALDKLADAQGYFNKNNPQSIELENIVSNIDNKF